MPPTAVKRTVPERIPLVTSSTTSGPEPSEVWKSVSEAMWARQKGSVYFMFDSGPNFIVVSEPAFHPHLTSYEMGPDVGDLTASLTASEAVGEFRQRLGGLPVDSVYWKRDGDRVRVWTVIPEPEDELQEKIYEAELAVWDTRPFLKFEFGVLFRLGRALADVRPADASEAVAAE